MQIDSLLEDNTRRFFLEIIKRVVFFTFYFIIWNVTWAYLHFLNIQIIKDNCWIIFLKCFTIVYFWWVLYFISVIFICKWFNTWIYLWIPLYFSIIQCNCYCLLKRFNILIFWIYCWFFSFLFNLENHYLNHNVQKLFYYIYNIAD